MLTELNDRLEAVKEKERTSGKWQERVLVLEAERRMLEQQVSELERIWQQEHEDVERLIGGSLTGFVLSLLGRKEERLQREEVEAVEAKAKYDAAVAAVQFNAEELRRAKGRLAESADWQRDYQQIIADKERMLRQYLPEKAREIDRLTERKSAAGLELKELEEAIHAGEHLRAPLAEAQTRLDSARNWGTYDMLGGGMLSTHIKHGKIGDATASIHEARGRLGRFQKELRDVNMLLAVDIDISSFLKFADYFFDGFFSDWMVQGKIKRAQEQVSEALLKVDDALFKLTHMAQERRDEREQLNYDLIRAIETA
jgi:DNA repair exonuclease SbcCD ATPase subunit